MGRLLLHADGILAEFWDPLGPAPPYEPPDRWDAPHVAHRFAEAFSTLIKMPLGPFGPAGIRTAWPKYQSEWEDLLAMLDGDALRAVHSQRNRVIVLPTAAELSAMDKALNWPGRYLPQAFDLVRALNFAALAQARDVSIGTIARRGKHAGVRSSVAWHELALEAADRIALGLRIDKVAVF